MKRSAYVFFISSVFLATGSLSFLASSFAPIANTHRKTYDCRCPTGALKKDLITTRKKGFLHIHSSSPTEDMESVSPKEILGPGLPPIKGSAKRLFLVRHGEVINPGKKRESLQLSIKRPHRNKKVLRN